MLIFKEGKCIVAFVLSCFSLGGCSPTLYCRQLTELERNEMTCREIDMEISKTLAEIDACNKNFDQIFFPNVWEYEYKNKFIQCQNELLMQLQELRNKKECTIKDSKSLNRYLSGIKLQEKK